MGRCSWDFPIAWGLWINLLNHSRRNWLSAGSGRFERRSRSRVLALRDNFYLIRYSILFSQMVGLSLGVFSIAWLVVDFLNSSMWYRRGNA